MKSGNKKRKRENFDILSFKEKKQFLEFLRLKIKFQHLLDEFTDVDINDLIKKLEDEIYIPVSIFNEKLSCFESICKYLKENLGFSNKKISSLTNKNSKSIWQAYNNSKKKYPDKFEVIESKYFIPISILTEIKSILESVVVYLKDSYDLSYHEIAILLERDDRTIWAVYNRARKKYGK